MAVFGGSTKISRAVADPGTDKTLPSSGSLSWGGITGASGVAGTTGVDCKLVSGDRWQQISGTHTENIGTNLKTTVTGDQTHTIQGNQTIEIGGKKELTVAQQCLETMVGPHMITNMDVFNETRLSVQMKVHGDLEWQRTQDWQVQYGTTNLSHYSLLIEVEEFHVEAALNHYEAKGVHTYASVGDGNAVLTKFETAPINASAKLTDNKINTLALWIKILNTEVGAMDTKVGMRLNALPTFSTSSPFS